MCFGILLAFACVATLFAAIFSYCFSPESDPSPMWCHWRARGGYKYHSRDRRCQGGCRDMACSEQQVKRECQGTEKCLFGNGHTVQEEIREEIREELPEEGNDRVPDAVLHVESESFFVNRERLAQLSPYFRALFFGGGRESKRRHIEIKGVDLDKFRSLMQYAQSFRLPLDRKNVLGVLEAANYLQLEKARLLCCKFLERELHLSNCLGMMAYAWQLGCVELYTAAREVVLTHIPALASEEDILHLTKETIADLLASDNLFVPREDLAFEITLRWATFDPSREDDFLELAGLVRPESLSLPYITDLLAKMKSSDPRAKLICKLNNRLPSSWTMGRSVSRTHSREMLYLLGDNVVVSGGYFRDVLWYSVDWVRIYQCSNESWVDGPALQKSRHSHCSVGLGHRAFVMGGSMDEGPVATVERLVLGAEGWDSVSPMVQAVERAAVVTMGSCIYVACGLDVNGEVYSGIQRYRAEEDQWDVVSYSPFPRYDLLATELNGALYLLGGKALRLDIDTDEWTVLEEECLDRKFFSGCATVNGQIYLISERKINKVSTNMVLLDPYIDTCLEIDSTIPCPVPVRGCVTVRMTGR
ncbi:kelch-like protein 23 isoform X2 [Brachyhypopomus gauderio]|uniref:kelch-like protein 23 isoform X2 n=1 Tax=Brachyhypopomus gauderio TaxID=698409 RepID=UPI004042942D